MSSSTFSVPFDMVGFSFALGGTQSSSIVSESKKFVTENIEVSYYVQPQEKINYLKNHYLFEEPEVIKRFLIINPDLTDILIEAYFIIKKIWGDLPIYLELHRDPEEGWEELFIVIKSSYSPEEARSLMNKLEEEWYLDIMDKVGNKLCITEEPL